MEPRTPFGRNKLWLLIALSLLLVNLSCGPLATAAPTRPPATVVIAPSFTPPPPTETLPPTETPIPTVTPTLFVPKATFKIAAQLPLSVSNVDIGDDILHGAELAVDQLAGPLMSLGYQVELVAYDDQMEIAPAVDASRQIVADPAVLCVVGPAISRILNQVKEIYHQAGLPFISPSATSPMLSASGYLEFNRLVGRDDVQGRAAAQFAKSKGFVRAFVMNQNSEYAREIAATFKTEAGQLGMNVVGSIATDEAANFTNAIERIKAGNVDVVYFSTTNVEQAGAFFREARAAGYLGAFLSHDGINNPVLLELAGPLLLDGGGFYYTSTAARPKDYPGAAQFVHDYEASFSAQPGLYSAQAYDAAGICMRAIEVAAEGGQSPTRSQVANAIRGLQDHAGITGMINFTDRGEPDPGQYFVFQVTSPDPVAWAENPLLATYAIATPR